jgi:hypothetical protein
MADEREQDGLGRDAAHGDDRPATSGGSYGRNTGHSGDDLLGLDDQGAATDRQPDGGGGRRGLEGKGFDAGTGYGGGGNDSAYDGESSFGGQAGSGQGMSGSGGGRSIPRGTDEHSGGEGGEGGEGGADGGGADETDLDARPDAGRRDPTR